MTAYGDQVDAPARLANEPFTLGPGVNVDPVLNQIVREDRSIAVEPRVMELLVFLAQRPGQIVSKRELIEQVWRTHVVDDAVHRAVSLLRSALGDCRLQPALIETVSRRGYRLLVTPNLVKGGAPSILSRRLLGPAAAVAVVVAALIVIGLQLNRETTAAPHDQVAEVPQPTLPSRDSALPDPEEKPTGSATTPRARETAVNSRLVEKASPSRAFAPEAPAPIAETAEHTQPKPLPAAAETPRAEAPPAPSAAR